MAKLNQEAIEEIRKRFWTKIGKAIHTINFQGGDKIRLIYELDIANGVIGTGLIGPDKIIWPDEEKNPCREFENRKIPPELKKGESIFLDGEIGEVVDFLLDRLQYKVVFPNERVVYIDEEEAEKYPVYYPPHDHPPSPIMKSDSIFGVPSNKNLLEIAHRRLLMAQKIYDSRKETFEAEERLLHQEELDNLCGVNDITIIQESDQMDVRTGDIMPQEEANRRIRNNAELGQFLKAAPAATEEQINRGRVLPNELCPCGSKKKFKRCCEFKVT